MLYNAVGRHDGKPAAVIAVFQIPGTNALDVANKIKAEMANLSKRFPRDMEYLVSLDTTLPVSEGINEIVHTLFEAVALVIIVVFIFLQNWRATLIPLMTVPVSLVGAFIFFPLLGFSINVLSLLGLVLAIGIVVDDAIVVVEAVMHHIEHGMAPKEATIKAMEEVSGPVIAIGLILSAVFVPVGFMGGITGRLYQQFAITIALSVLLSVVNALTLSPALAALLLKPATGKRSLLTPFYNGFNKVFGCTTDTYVSFSAILIRKMFRSMAFIGVLMYVIVVLVRHIPGGFVPEEDQGYIMVNAQLPDAASLERTDAVMKKAEAILEKNEAIEGFNTISGYSLLTSAYSSNMGFFFVQLKPWEERKTEEAHANGVVAALNKAFAQQIPEARCHRLWTAVDSGPRHRRRLHDAAAGSQRRFAGLSGRADAALHGGGAQAAGDRTHQHAVPGGGPAGLRRYRSQQGAEVRRAAERREHHARRAARQLVRERLQPVRPRLQGVRPGRAGVPAGSEAARPVLREEQGRRHGAARYAGHHAAGRRTRVHESLQPVPIGRAHRVFRPRAFRRRRRSMRSKQTAREVLPPDMSFDWADMSYQERKAPGVAVVFMLAIFLVFLILAAQYQSWGLPFSVLLGTPFAAFGAYLGLWLARLYLGPSYVNNVFAQIGLIMLIGLAAKNAILIVEFAKMEFDQGKPLVEAALNAAKLRFRPILMTAFAFILGVVPLLTASGAGAEVAQGDGHDGVLRHARRDDPRRAARFRCCMSPSRK